MSVALLHYEAILQAYFHLSETHWFPNQSICVFIVMLEHFWSMCSCACQNMVKKTLWQVSVYPSSGHFIELNAI